jgi:hypothetical protein
MAGCGVFSGLVSSLECRREGRIVEKLSPLGMEQGWYYYGIVLAECKHIIQLRKEKLGQSQ